jgi:hypothetical protein
VSAAIEIIAGIGIVAYVIGRQLMGEPLRGKRVVLLPVILTVIGVLDLGGSKVHVRPIDIACLVVGGIIVAGIGAAQGLVTRLENRNGHLWGQLPVKGLWLWALLVASRVVMTLVAHGLGAEVAASSSTILLMLGISRLGQAAVVLPRAMSAGIPFAPEKDGASFLAGLTGSAPTAGPSTTAPPVSVRKVPAAPSESSQDGMDWPALGRQVGRSLQNHHENHQNRHQNRRNERRRDR